jgi:hypothetical protein
MKRSVVVIFVAAIILGIAVWRVRAQQPSASPVQKQLKPIMQLKLEYSQAILAALAIEDYDKLAQNAQKLSLLSLESNWNVLTTEEYIQQSAAFRRACGVIKEAAHEKNVDRAALGFMDLTVRCVECHKYMRKDAAALKPGPKNPTAPNSN